MLWVEGEKATFSIAAKSATPMRDRRQTGRLPLLMVDAGGSDGFWKHGYKWALRTTQMPGA